VGHTVVAAAVEARLKKSNQLIMFKVELLLLEKASPRLILLSVGVYL